MIIDRRVVQLFCLAMAERQALRRGLRIAAKVGSARFEDNVRAALLGELSRLTTLLDVTAEAERAGLYLRWSRQPTAELFNAVEALEATARDLGLETHTLSATPAWSKVRAILASM